MKGFLAWHQVPFAKTHDLFTLLQQVAGIVGNDAEALSTSVLLLDDYSVSIRYPQEYEEEPDEKSSSTSIGFMTRRYLSVDSYRGSTLIFLGSSGRSFFGVLPSAKCFSSFLGPCSEKRNNFTFLSLL